MAPRPNLGGDSISPQLAQVWKFGYQQNYITIFI